MSSRKSTRPSAPGEQRDDLEFPRGERDFSATASANETLIAVDDERTERAYRLGPARSAAAEGTDAGVELRGRERLADVIRFLEAFLQAWRFKKRKQWAPLYLRGLLLPGERKSIEPIAARVAPGHDQELRHFVSESDWDEEPIEEVLWDKVDAMVGGDESFLIICMSSGSHPKSSRYAFTVARHARLWTRRSATANRDSSKSRSATAATLARCKSSACIHSPSIGPRCFRAGTSMPLTGFT